MRIVAAFLTLIVLAALAAGGCRGEGEVSPTPTGVATVTPSPTGVPEEGLRLVYKEFGSEADIIWLAAAAEPQKRTKVAEVEHAPDVGISASLSPDGEHIAYLVLAAPGGDPAMDAQAWLLDLDSGKTRLLAEGLDHLSKPVWSPAGDSIVVRRNGPWGDIGRTASLVGVDVSDGSETLLLEEQEVFELFPIGYSVAYPPTDTLAFARITLGGTDFRCVATDAPAVHASDEWARDWHLSPDGRRVAYLARQATDDRIAMRAFVVDMAGTAGPQPLSQFAKALEAGDHFKPLWHPDGQRIAVGRTPDDGSGGAALVSLAGGELEEVTPGPDQGFDVPAGWSPEGDYLAVRSFEGSSAAQPGREHLVIIELGERRQTVAGRGNLEFIGWLPSGSQ